MASLRLRCPACGAEYRLDEATRAVDLTKLGKPYYFKKDLLAAAG